MPAKGTSKITPAQKAAVAKGRLAGKTIREISKTTGLKPDAVAHVAVGPEVKGIISRFFAAEEKACFRLMGAVYRSLEGDMESDKLTPEQRERARAQAVAIIQLGQPKAPDTATAAGPGVVSGGGVLLGDMLTVYRQLTAAPIPSGEAD